MRLLGPVLATALVCLASVPETRADMRAPMRTSELGFEAFGTSFCFHRGCDVKLPEEATAPAPVRVDHPPRVTIFGFTLCSRLEATGPACDVVWVPPTPAAAWRDMTALRAAELMP